MRLAITSFARQTLAFQNCEFVLSELISVLTTISYPEFSGFVVSGWSPGETLGNGIVTAGIPRLTVRSFLVLSFVTVNNQ